MNLLFPSASSTIIDTKPAPEPIKMVEALPKLKLKPIKPLAQKIVEKPAPKPKRAVAPRPSVRIVKNCGDNKYAQYIYQRESGCNLYARNAGGCLGIGQACPGSKLTNVCDLSSYSCQNRFFTNYVNSRYGGWQGAYNFWIKNHWY